MQVHHLAMYVWLGPLRFIRIIIWATAHIFNHIQDLAKPVRLHLWSSLSPELPCSAHGPWTSGPPSTRQPRYRMQLVVFSLGSCSPGIFLKSLHFMLGGALAHPPQMMAEGTVFMVHGLSSRLHRCWQASLMPPHYEANKQLEERLHLALCSN